MSEMAKMSSRKLLLLNLWKKRITFYLVISDGRKNFGLGKMFLQDLYHSYDALDIQTPKKRTIFDV